MRKLLPNLDWNNEHLKDTPARLERMYKEIFKNANKDIMKEKLLTLFPAVDNQMIIVKNIQFTSMCAHHFLPFFGRVDIGYIPSNNITGISKLARLVKEVSLKPQIQELLTKEVYDYLMLYLKPKKLFIKVSAEHQCMSSRGIRAVGSQTVTFKYSHQKDISIFLTLIQ